MTHLVAAGGGILGGTMVQRILGSSLTESTALLTSMAGAFVVGRVAGAIAAGALDSIGGREQAVTTRAVA